MNDEIQEKTERYESAKEVAGKAIGQYGLMYITAIVLIGVGSSYFLTESAITAVMTMVGGALVALINMMNGIAGTAEKPDRPEFEVIQNLIAQLAEKEPPMRVDVEEGKVIVRKGDDITTMKSE
jgi:hypothetical protein